MRHSPSNGKLQAGKGTLSEIGANTQKGNNETSSGTGKNTRNKVASISYRQRSKQEAPRRATHKHIGNSRKTPNTTMVTQEGCPRTEQRTETRRNKDEGITTTRKKRKRTIAHNAQEQ
jgi:hypothetical protein